MKLYASTTTLALLCLALYAATPEIEITLAHGSAAEEQTRTELRALLKQYDLGDWVWTRRVVIMQGAIPHSHPVLTLNTRESGMRLLSAFVHEQYHWYETAHPSDVAAAITELKKAYPGLPVGGQDGAADEQSSYLHVVVCYAEWQKMKALAGTERAREVMQYLAGDHYRGIYRFVLEHEPGVADVVRRHKLMPQE
jgi:hypothetical protein